MQVPDDLDLSLWLRDCDESVTMATLFGFGDAANAEACDGGLEAFASRRPEFGVTEVKNATMASDESKNKLLDTAKVNRGTTTATLCDNITVTLHVPPFIAVVERYARVYCSRSMS